MTTRLWVASLATAALLVTGCGASEDGAAPEPSPEASAPASSAPASPTPTATSPEASPESAAPEQSAPEPAKAVITIKDFKYDGPGSVAPGTEVVVRNEDDAAHTGTAEGNGGFDVTIDPGGTAMFTAPSEPGEFPYVCSFHANMSGTLVVE